MTKTTFTTSELTTLTKAAVAAEMARMADRPAEMPRAAWRMANPSTEPRHWQVRDTAFKTQPIRSLQLDVNGNPYDVWVWAPKNVIERIDLRAADADARLARYVKA